MCSHLDCFSRGGTYYEKHPRYDVSSMECQTSVNSLFNHTIIELSVRPMVDQRRSDICTAARAHQEYFFI